MGKLSTAKKITTTEKYCIEGMFHNDMETKAIAKVLGRSVGLVEEYVSELEEKEKEENSPDMVLKKTVNGDDGVSIMTPAGSIKVDTNREKNKNVKVSNRGTRAIHSIRK
tara:strand:+ start:291 stop:620 length:330 start_codon:yes stop_codon:yes gene_type:complete